MIIKAITALLALLLMLTMGDVITFTHLNLQGAKEDAAKIHKKGFLRLGKFNRRLTQGR